MATGINSDRLIFTLAILLLCNHGAFSAEFFGLGFLDGDLTSHALGVSEDGAVVVGESHNFVVGKGPGTHFAAYRWTRDTGMQEIVFGASAIAVSDDGRVIAGIYWPSYPNGVGRAFSWTEASGLTEIGGGRTAATGASADGSTLVGWFNSERVFRWTAETGLVYVGGGAPADVSADGSVVVGGGSGWAWRWTQETGQMNLGDLGPISRANAVSNDGSVIVGSFRAAGSQQPNHAFRWTDQTGMVELESPATINSSAGDVSGDGSIIVGTAQFDSASINEPFVWTAEQGMRPLVDVLINEYGLSSSLSGWSGLKELSISTDGDTIVGQGINLKGLNEAWYADLRPRRHSWNSDSDGNWSVAGNWTLGVPNDNAEALLARTITAPRTVTIDLPVTLSRIGFDSENAYTIVGANAVTMDAKIGMARINVAAGSHTIAAPVTLADNVVINIAAVSQLSIRGALDAGGKTLTKNGTGTLTVNHLRAAGLLLNGGTVAIAPDVTDANASVLDGLSIAGGTTPTARLDLNNNAAILDYENSNPVSTVRSQLLAGRGRSGLGATWAGQGIASSAATAANAAEPESRSIGYAENSTLPLGPYTTFRGQPVDDTSLLIAYTRTGDANLDGIVNDDDVTIVGATYAPGVSNPHWALGDFDYNGFVDDDDVTLLGVFYDPSASPLGVPIEGNGHVSAVPEPGALLLALIAVALILARRSVSRPVECLTVSEQDK